MCIQKMLCTHTCDRAGPGGRPETAPRVRPLRSTLFTPSHPLSTPVEEPDQGVDLRQHHGRAPSVTDVQLLCSYLESVQRVLP